MSMPQCVTKPTELKISHFILLEMLLCSLPMKFLHVEESWACFHAAGQAISTVLCFIPPRPADWMSREKPSRRLDDTTTWEKPLVRSAAMAALNFYSIQMKRRSKLNLQFNCFVWRYGKTWCFWYSLIDHYLIKMDKIPHGPVCTSLEIILNRWSRKLDEPALQLCHLSPGSCRCPQGLNRRWSVPSLLWSVRWKTGDGGVLWPGLASAYIAQALEVCRERERIVIIMRIKG